MGGAFGGLKMDNIGIIVLAASFLCGIIGAALAKAAKKKNSLPLVIVSTALAVFTLIGLIVSAAMLLFIK